MSLSSTGIIEDIVIKCSWIQTAEAAAPAAAAPAAVAAAAAVPAAAILSAKSQCKSAACFIHAKPENNHVATVRKSSVHHHASCMTASGRIRPHPITSLSTSNSSKSIINHKTETRKTGEVDQAYYFTS